MPIASNLGYPRIGPSRELKTALESYWAGRQDLSQLLAEARRLRAERWRQQSSAGLEHIPSNDFSLYDHVLDTTLMVGAVPERFGGPGAEIGPDLIFAMARGVSGETELAPLDMTKWFDTNYHYLVPELAPDQAFSLAWPKPVEEFEEAKALGIRTRPVLLGPVSWLRLGRMVGGQGGTLQLLDRLLPVYEELLERLAGAGVEWVQIDEPCLSQDLPVEALEALETAYQRLGRRVPSLRLLLASYFSALGPNLEMALGLPVAAVHLDLVNGPEDLEPALALAPEGLSLSLGVVDGHNVWRTDPDRALAQLERAVTRLGGSRVLVAPSCSLLHVPVSLRSESGLDPELRAWLAFAEEKVVEVSQLARAAGGQGPEELEPARAACAARRASARVTDPALRARLQRLTPEQLVRPGDGPVRRLIWRQRVSMPLLPTTTVGSFPQVPELRRARARLRRGELDRAAYEALIEDEVRRVIRFQEETGLDLLVHGEPERNDMVEYFAEQLQGFATTRAGWVQSYGSRCAKPPIIYGDVSRPEPMTVRWAVFAQGLTERPVKGMLTGPVTMLQWSFARDDQPRGDTCRQIALALRDEVQDLEAAGISVIQIDEPALREGLPLHRGRQAAYLRWAVDCFRLVAAGAGAATQVHTHMCYSEFDEIMDTIAELDADVLYIEAARSGMSLLGSFARHHYPNEVGPGIYDIHSPLVPTVAEMTDRLRLAARAIPPERLWAVPDCGLKTRGWAEVEPALHNLVTAARQVASELDAVPAARS